MPISQPFETLLPWRFRAINGANLSFPSMHTCPWEAKFCLSQAQDSELKENTSVPSYFSLLFICIVTMEKQ